MKNLHEQEVIRKEGIFLKHKLEDYLLNDKLRKTKKKEENKCCEFEIKRCS